MMKHRVVELLDIFGFVRNDNPDAEMQSVALTPRTAPRDRGEGSVTTRMKELASVPHFHVMLDNL